MTYDNFKEDILDCFKEIIDKYSLTLLDNPREKGWYLLRNSNCTLFFSFDRGEINCAIKSQRIDIVNVNELYPKANPIASLPNSGNPWSPINQLNKYAFKFENSDLKKVLLGDDSWLK